MERSSQGAQPSSASFVSRHAVLLPYAITICLSAFLVFQVQPLITKSILPWFGGSAAVWGTALAFFQLSLLGGYLYAHWLTTSCQPRTQVAVHCSLLVASCAVLPIVPSAEWRQAAQHEPTLTILALLLLTIGVPYIALSATTPLLQAWYARRTESGVPYRLFSLSNLASTLALLSFPFLVEPNLDSRTQAYGWSALYVLFAASCICAAWRSGGAVAAPARVSPSMTAANSPPTVRQVLMWLSLAGCASAMLVAITGHLSTNIAPLPLLWVVPLTIYLLTFVVTFSKDRLYSREFLFPWLASALGWMAFSVSASGGNVHVRYAIPLYLIGLFLTCMWCHGELAQRRPSAAYVTTFYLYLALGGAVGGAFAAVVAPNVFDTAVEFPLLLAAVGTLCVVILWHRNGTRRKVWSVRVALLAGLTFLVAYLAYQELVNRQGHVLITRNFYGALRVEDSALSTPFAARSLMHGTILHGSQSLNDEYRYTPGSYYSQVSGVGRALRALQERDSIRYGVIGLGAGVLSAYARSSDYVRFYELNPAVLSIAQRDFSFLEHARTLGADVDVIVGDARISLEAQANQSFDLLVLDAFSSDAVPVHLLSQESFETYFRHLRAGGVLAVHITNRYVNLEPVCAKAAQHANRFAAVVRDGGSVAPPGSAPTTWVLIAASRGWFEHAAFADATLRPANASPGFRMWTDQFSSLWPLVTLSSAGSRSD